MNTYRPVHRGAGMREAKRRLSTGIAAMTACLVGVAFAAAPASAKTITLHFFEKQTSMSFVGPDGTPLPATAPPATGDRFSFTHDEYVGNHKHHASRPTASTHVECTITGPGAALCSGQIALGGSMLLANNFLLNLTTDQSSPTTVKINDGTLNYRHAHGTLSSKPIGKTNTNDTTIKFTT